MTSKDPPYDWHYDTGDPEVDAWAEAHRDRVFRAMQAIVDRLDAFERQEKPPTARQLRALRRQIEQARALTWVRFKDGTMRRWDGVPMPPEVEQATEDLLRNLRVSEPNHR